MRLPIAIPRWPHAACYEGRQFAAGPERVQHLSMSSMRLYRGQSSLPFFQHSIWKKSDLKIKCVSVAHISYSRLQGTHQNQPQRSIVSFSFTGGAGFLQWPPAKATGVFLPAEVRRMIDVTGSLANVSGKRVYKSHVFKPHHLRKNRPHSPTRVEHLCQVTGLRAAFWRIVVHLVYGIVGQSTLFRFRQHT